jgi:hypothetical protein
MMIRDDDDNALQALELPVSAGSPPRRKPYQSPALVEWGSIVELTHGLQADIQDDGFSGSGGV